VNAKNLGFQLFWLNLVLVSNNFQLCIDIVLSVERLQARDEANGSNFAFLPAKSWQTLTIVVTVEGSGLTFFFNGWFSH